MLLLLAVFASAQNSTITLVNPHTGLDTDQGKVLNYVDNIPKNGTVRHINWVSQDQIASNGNIVISLPNENNGKPISFELLDVDFASTTEYAIYGKGEFGNISLYVTPQGIGGTIDLISKVYAAFPLGGTKGLLIELAQTSGEATGCGTVEDMEKEAAGFCDTDCGSAVLDVLAMVTPEARQWVTDNWGWLGQWFLFMETHNINGAFVNSLVPGKRVRVRLVDYTPDFVLTSNLGTDINLFRNSANAQQLALQNNADIRFLLTNEDYPNTSGAFGAIPIDQLNPAAMNKIGIVDVPFIGSIRYTFAHEIAHHFGCWHSTNTMSGCRNGMHLDFPDQQLDRNTIMGTGTTALPFAPNFTRIQHFSNPAVSFGGLPTGVADTRDNAAQIRGAFCEVANKFPGQYSASISKNTIGIICEGDILTFEANVFAGICQDPFTLMFSDCATGPYQYEWRVSNFPSFNNSPVIGNAQSFTFTVQYCPIYVRVTVVSANGLTTTSTNFYNCASAIICDGLVQEPTDRNGKNLPTARGTIRCVPNPAYDQIKVLFSEPGQDAILTVTDVAGNVKLAQNINTSQGDMMLDISDWSQGVWFLYVQGQHLRQTSKFTIIR
jgi:hypothetical protein